MSGLVALQYLSLTGCNRVQGDALTALAPLTALRYAAFLTVCYYHFLLSVKLLLRYSDCCGSLTALRYANPLL